MLSLIVLVLSVICLGSAAIDRPITPNVSAWGFFLFALAALIARLGY